MRPRRPALPLPRAAARTARAALLLAASCLVPGCGDGDADPAASREPAPPPTYTAGGAIEGVTATSRPSIVLVDVAGVRYDAVFPAAGKTPLLPGLAKWLSEATSFENAVSAAGWDVPALASMLTGLAPKEHHVVQVYGGLTSELNASWPTLPEILRAQGWRTAGFSRRGSSLDAFGLAQGFDRWDESWSGGDDAGVAALRDAGTALAGAGSPPNAPTFLFLRPTLVMPPISSGSADAPLPAAEARAAYADAARALDGEFVRLLGALKELPATRDAVVVVTACHGYALGENGGRVGPGLSTRDEVIHVPLGIAAPGIDRGRVRGSCSLRDLTPTILALVGLPRPADAGHPLQPLAARPTSEGLPAYAEDWAPLALKPPGVRRLHTLRTPRFKYVARLHVASRQWDEQYYDLEGDPGETTPLPEVDPARLGDEMAQAVAAMGDWLRGRVEHFERVGEKGYFLSDD